MSAGRGAFATVDVGTTSIKLGIYDSGLVRVHSESVTVPVGPDGLQDAEELFKAVRHLLLRGKELGAKSAGIATYRASTVAWKRDGTPLTPIVTWTDRGVYQTYKRLPAHIKAVGKIPPLDLIVSPYSPVIRFLRLRELCPNLPAESMQWTIDAYLAYRLVGKFVSDATNATLTGIIDPRNMKEIGVVKSLFGLKSAVPAIVENTEKIGEFEGVELNALIADQQAACVGEWAVERGTAKVTNGTGTFVDVPTDGFARRGQLIPLVILKERGTTRFGVEGYLPTTGRAVDLMLRIGLIRSYSDLETEERGEVIFIPALSGLQVPHAPNAKGLIAGLELDSDGRAVASGLLTAISFHVRLVLEQSGESTKILRADGGLSRSGELLRRISEATGIDVERAGDLEATSRGLAMLQVASTRGERLQEVAKARSEIEVFSRRADPKLGDEYRKWQKLATWLKNSRDSFQAE
ncbi:MAG: hypothetical protein JRM80_11120 [Nitrososphaerota archaeon]|nr:hypothetical protein [Nitrososphaerota archaeon]MDG6990589.1 hypothetical protein [Nitrososphaerota archaeon]